MTITDIEEKIAKERKRERKLVHLTNTLARNFVESLRLKSKSDEGGVEYISKSFFDYLFFEEQKEIGEINKKHIQDFLLEYAPRRVTLSEEFIKKTPDFLIKLFIFLETQGHIKNSGQLNDALKENKIEFLKLIEKQKRAQKKKTAINDEKMTKKPMAPIPLVVKVGRNDPCPCGSGKKYKKCCGRLEKI